MKTAITAIALAALTVSIAAQQRGGGAGGGGRGPGRGGLPVPGTAVVPPGTTAFFPCGNDVSVPMSTPVDWQSIALAADRRFFVPCPGGSHDEKHWEMRDAKLLEDAARSPIAEFRRAAVAAYGRLGRPEFVGAPGVSGVLLRALDDGEPVVRREAASAIADALSGAVVEPDDSGPHPVSPDVIAFARSMIEERLVTERDDDVAGMYLETLGRLKYADDGTKEAVENLLVVRASGTPVRVLGAAKGLESLIRLSPRRPIQPQTRDLLQFLVVNGNTQRVRTVPGSAEAQTDEARLARVRRLAMQSLATLREDDPEFLTRAAHDVDWQVRRLVATVVHPNRADMAEIRSLLLADAAFQVRYEMVGVEARSSRACQTVLDAFKDPATIVAIHAIELIPRGCQNAEAIEARLEELASDLQSFRSAAGSGTEWQKPARALASLARLNPTKVTEARLQAASNHSFWQVGVTAATIAGQMKNYPLLLRLASAGPANVRTAALEAIGAAKSDDIITAQIRALAGPDFQLIRTAANMLKGTPEPRREDASVALLNALAELTKQAWDTSRDPRVAILQRLQELLAPELGMRLLDYVGDFDPKVRAAAQAAHRALVGGVTFPSARPTRRYPLQPTETQLNALPGRAIIRLSDGQSITIELLPREAPITVAKFAELASLGYYNGLTFHRVVPNFVVQGGSPGANEYVGNPRYWRDESSSLPHTRGAVGISTRGHDTGDGQIFIDLVDLPRLDHDYTVFARVISGLDVIDRMLEGARIESVTVR